MKTYQEIVDYTKSSKPWQLSSEGVDVEEKQKERKKEKSRRGERGEQLRHGPASQPAVT